MAENTIPSELKLKLLRKKQPSNTNSKEKVSPSDKLVNPKSADVGVLTTTELKGLIGGSKTKRVTRPTSGASASNSNSGALFAPSSVLKSASNKEKSCSEVSTTSAEAMHDNEASTTSGNVSGSRASSAKAGSSRMVRPSLIPAWHKKSSVSGSSTFNSNSNSKSSSKSSSGREKVFYGAGPRLEQFGRSTGKERSGAQPGVKSTGSASEQIESFMHRLANSKNGGRLEVDSDVHVSQGGSAQPAILLPSAYYAEYKEEAGVSASVAPEHDEASTSHSQDKGSGLLRSAAAALVENDIQIENSASVNEERARSSALAVALVADAENEDDLIDSLDKANARRPDLRSFSRGVGVNNNSVPATASSSLAHVLDADRRNAKLDGLLKQALRGTPEDLALVEDCETGESPSPTKRILAGVAAGRIVGGTTATAAVFASGAIMNMKKPVPPQSAPNAKRRGSAPAATVGSGGPRAVRRPSTSGSTSTNAGAASSVYAAPNSKPGNRYPARDCRSKYSPVKNGVSSTNKPPVAPRANVNVNVNKRQVQTEAREAPASEVEQIKARHGPAKAKDVTSSTASATDTRATQYIRAGNVCIKGVDKSKAPLPLKIDDTDEFNADQGLDSPMSPSGGLSPVAGGSYGIGSPRATNTRNIARGRYTRNTLLSRKYASEFCESNAGSKHTVPDERVAVRESGWRDH